MLLIIPTLISISFFNTLIQANSIHNNNNKNRIIHSKRSNSTQSALVKHLQVFDTSLPPAPTNLGGLLSDLLPTNLIPTAAIFGTGDSNSISSTTAISTPTLILTSIRTSIKTALITSTSTSASLSAITSSSSSSSTSIISPSVIIVNVTSTLPPSTSSTTSSTSSTPTSTQPIIPVTVLSTALASTSTSTSLLTVVPTSTNSASTNNLTSNSGHTSPAKITTVTFIIIGSVLVALLLAFTLFRKFGFGRKSNKWESRTRAPSAFWEPSAENSDMTEIDLRSNSNNYNYNKNMSGRDEQGNWIGFEDDGMSIRSVRSGRSGQGMAGIGAVRQPNYAFDRPISPEFTRDVSTDMNRNQDYPSVQRYASSGGRSYTKGVYP